MWVPVSEPVGDSGTTILNVPEAYALSFFSFRLESCERIGVVGGDINSTSSSSSCSSSSTKPQTLSGSFDGGSRTTSGAKESQIGVKFSYFDMRSKKSIMCFRACEP